jgi:predicted Zn-dependent protease
MSERCAPDEIQAIRAEIYVARRASPGILRRIEELTRQFPESPQLWILRGDALRLGDGTGRPLAEAKRCYQRALALDPGNGEAAEALARFIDLHERAF